jgi:putative SOS response-associated peptidase YedK
MCGRFKRSGPVEAVGELFQLPEPPLVLRPRWNIAPTQKVAVVGLKADSVTRGLAELRWGLVPAWANAPAQVKPQINARADTVAEKPTFREAFAHQRCLVVADGYYEWHERDKPYLMRRQDGGPFAFAGIWDVWGEGTDRLHTCAFITTDAAEWLRPVHPRMPVILRPDQYDAWLSHDTPKDDLLTMLAPYAGEDLEAVRVTTAVNKVANDTEECVEPVGAS